MIGHGIRLVDSPHHNVLKRCFRPPIQALPISRLILFGFQTIWKLAPLAWLALLASAWFMNVQYRRVLLAVWTPAIMLALLVAFYISPTTASALGKLANYKRAHGLLFVIPASIAAGAR